MVKIKTIIKNIKKIPKERYITVLVLLIFAVTVSIPTLARYKNRLDLEEILNKNEVWDGTIALGYHDGTGEESDPYIISNAKELAYFSNQLKTTDYAGKYFKITNDILINKGTFNFDGNQMTYTIDGKTMYIENYTNKLYDNTELNNNPISTVNSFESLQNFAGYLDGGHYRIYGLFMTSQDEKLGLFTNLNGTIENLYIENAMIYGGAATAILASDTTEAKIKNVYTSGNVIGTLSNTDIEKKYIIDDYNVTKTNAVLNEKLSLPVIYLEKIKSIKLKGTYSSSEENELLINKNVVVPGEFSVDLGTDLITEVSLEINDEISSEISLTNMTFEVIYETGFTSTIVAKASNTTISNVLNKANVYAIDNASGLIGITKDTNVKNAYNTGNIVSVNNATALIDTIGNSESDIMISNIYNAGTLNAKNTYPLLKEIYDNKKVEIKNTFNISTANANLNTNQDITYTNVVDVNQTSIEGIEKKTLEEIKDTTYLKDTLNYKEFVDNTVLEINEDAVWVYETSYFPILYIDDLNNPIAELKVGAYKWDSIGYELSEIYLSSNTVIMITPKDVDETINAYYYIHKGNKALTKAQLENVSWEEYTDIVTLDEEGYYVIYAKVTDSDNNTKYISSEVMIMDLKAPNAVITMNDYHWIMYHEELLSLNIADKTDILIKTEDLYSEVSEVKYYISSTKLTKTDLINLEDNNWKDYEDKITLEQKGTYIIYVRTKDSLNHEAYYNTGIIIFGGFEEEITLNDGKITGQNNVNITNTSAVTYNFSYDKTTSYNDGYMVDLITTEKLPIGTNITLKNNNTNEVYKYIVTEEKTKFKLKEFVKVGQIDETNKFNEKDFIQEVNKNISITFDFVNSEVTKNVTFTAYLDVCDSSNKVVLSTLRSTFKTTKLYSNTNTSLTITKLNEVSEIGLNTDTITDVSFVSNLYIENLPNEPIYHSEFNNKKMGITIKLVDLEDNVIDKKYLKNVIFKIGDKTYSPDNDGIVRISLADEITRIEETLKIITYATETKLATGNYNFEITPYIASDGKHTNIYSTSKIIIPATTTKVEKEDYGFKIDMDQHDRVLYKKDNISKVNFKINEISNFASSNVRISLYKKQSLSGYDQVYDIIDLKDYILDDLQEAEENTYYITTDELELQFNTTLFNKTGYEIRFDLYDGNKFITTIRKKFIVR